MTDSAMSRRRSFQCPECDKIYDRADHFYRHVDSHRNERPYKCHECQRGFNRRDVLQRHQAIHEVDKEQNATGRKRRKERAIEACNACASAKMSCDDARPCRRCRTKNIQCVARSNSKFASTNPRSTTFLPETNQSSLQATGEYSYGNPQQNNSAEIETLITAATYLTTPPSSAVVMGGGPEGCPVSLSSAASPHPAPRLEPLHQNDTSPQAHQRSLEQSYDFPAFYGHMMLPGYNEAGVNGGRSLPPEASDFVPDPNVSLSEVDLFGNEFIPDLDRAIEFELRDLTEQPPQEQWTPCADSASLRVAAFKRSVWLWVPERNQGAFSDGDRIPFGEGDVAIAASSPNGQLISKLSIPGSLTASARDEILKLIIRTADSRVSISSFPSADYLDFLIKVGIAKRIETDAWLHPHTFYSQQPTPELLTALIAAGCVCFGITTINRTGIVLQEIVQITLSHLFERDNSILRDMQYLQASMIWLDIGIFCGYRRKMQIAESNLQPICTALRRSGAFERSTYPRITLPTLTEGDERSLDQAWREWVKQESRKRLVYHLFEHDIEVTVIMNRPPITSYAEFSLPLPAHRDLWLAPSAAAWKELWSQRYSEIPAPELNLRDILADPTLLSRLPSDTDSEIASSVLLHGLTAQVWEHRQKLVLFDHDRCQSSSISQLWMNSRQEDMYTMLRSVRNQIGDYPPVMIIHSELGMMLLHTDIDGIQKFAGKVGEDDARRIYPRLRDWGSSKGARTAVWHAGQVIRTSRRVPPYRLRGFDCLAVYHATLTLWVYGLLQCGKETQQTKPRSSSDTLQHAKEREGTGTEALVDLSGLEDPHVNAFINQNIGRPGLRMMPNDHSQGSAAEIDQAAFCDLRYPRSVMTATIQLFDRAYPHAASDRDLPPLVFSLRQLVHELGDLP